MNVKLIITAFVFLTICNSTSAQTTEMYAGNKRHGVDIMWFKNFTFSSGNKSRWLFFSRNRASINKENTIGLFGSTNAISYNFNNGVGLVTVAGFLNSGLTTKAGIQYVKAQGNWLFFGWLVRDIKTNGNIDLFGLFRYQPNLKGEVKGMIQVELFPTLQMETKFINFTQRLRIGPKINRLSMGLMADWNQTGKKNLTTTENYGAFLRYDF